MIGSGRYMGLVLATVHAPDQNMIDGPFCGPAWEGRQANLRGRKTGELKQPAHFRRQQIAVEIAHQHQSLPIGQQFGEIGNLHAARTGTERQMSNREMPGQAFIGKFCEQHTTPGNSARQYEMLDLGRLQAREQGVARAGEAADAACSLVRAEGESGFFRQIIRLVGESGAQTARVALLKTDHIEGRISLGQGIEVAAFAVRKHMRPRTRHILAICAGGRSGLDIAAKEF